MAASYSPAQGSGLNGRFDSLAPSSGSDFFVYAVRRGEKHNALSSSFFSDSPESVFSPHSSVMHATSRFRVCCVSRYDSPRGGTRSRGRNTGQYRNQSFRKGRRGDGQGRRKGPKELPPGAFWMEDPETKEKVFVWGVEGSPPRLTTEDLLWEPTEIIGSGEISDDQLWRLMEGEKYGLDTREDDDFEIDEESFYSEEMVSGYERRSSSQGEARVEEEENELEDDDDNQNDEEPEEENWTMRRRKLKIFGKDFKGKLLRKSGSLDSPTHEKPKVISGIPFEERKASSLDESNVENEVTGPSGSDSSLIFKGILSSEPKIDHSMSRGGNGSNFFKNFETKFAEAQTTGINETTGPIVENGEESISERNDSEGMRIQTLENHVTMSGKPTSRHTELSKTLIEDGLGDAAAELFRGNFKSMYADASGRDAEHLPEDDFQATTREQFPVLERGSSNQNTDEKRFGLNFEARRFGSRFESNLPDDHFEGIIELDDGSNEKFVRENTKTKLKSKATLLDALREKSLKGNKKPTPDSPGLGIVEGSDGENEGEPDTRPGFETSLLGSASQRNQKYLKLEINQNDRENFDESLVDQFFSAKSFSQIDASPQTIKALKSIAILRPSHIQALTFKPILNGRSCIMADQTGTGKTLAYLAPIFQRIKQQEEEGIQMAPPNRPYVLILTPTSELAAQVSRVCRSLSRGGLSLRTLIFTGGHSWRTQVENLSNGCEILVSTPGRLVQHLESGTLVLDHVQSIVIDEADIMFDEQEFYDMVQRVKNAVPLGSSQYIHVTATLPEDVHEKLVQQYANSITLIGPSLHRTSSGLTQILVDCSTGENEEKTEETAFLKKKSELLKILEKNESKKSIIFCNKIETCRKVENVLQRYDRSGKKFRVLPYHAAMAQDKAQENMKLFLEGKNSQKLILLCTDRASRGVDSLDVGLVILFDFPRDPSEYVRRVGRTARGAGGTGLVYVFVLGKQMGIAQRLLMRNQRGLPVHNVPGTPY